MGDTVDFYDLPDWQSKWARRIELCFMEHLLGMSNGYLTECDVIEGTRRLLESDEYKDAVDQSGACTVCRVVEDPARSK